MKKITLLSLLFVFSLITKAQEIVLTQSVDNQTIAGGSVACTSSDENEVPIGTSDNTFYRKYTLSDFNVDNTMYITDVRLAVIASEGSSADCTVSVYLSDGTFPNGSLVPLATENVTITGADNETFKMVELTNPITGLPGSTELVVEFSIPNLSEEMSFVRVGMNEQGENSPSYLSSEGCGITAPATCASIGYPDNHIILDLIASETLAVNTSLLENNISLYPNPTKDVLNVTVANGIQIEEAVLFDMLGKKVNAQLVNNQINTSSLNAGVYILQLTTNEGSLTKRIIKK